VTPSEALTEEIMPLLIQGKLFLPEDAAKYSAKLASGNMKSEDWLLVIEKASDKVDGQ
jgi:hypothetical protein